MGPDVRGAQSHCDLVTPFIKPFLSYSGSLVILKMRGFVESFLYQIMLIRRYSSYFELFRTRWSYPNNDEYFIIFRVTRFVHDFNPKKLQQNIYGFLNKMAMTCTPWEEALHHSLLSKWKIRNPLQYDLRYQVQLTKSSTGIELTPHIAKSDQRFHLPPTKEVVLSFSKMIPDVKTAYDFCAGSGSFSKVMADSGIQVTAIDSDPTHFNPCVGVTFVQSRFSDFKGDVKDFAVFDPPWFLEPSKYTEFSLWFEDYPITDAAVRASTFVKKSLLLVLPPNHIIFNIPGFRLTPVPSSGVIFFLFERSI